jgi:predicted Zn-dependent protease
MKRLLVASLVAALLGGCSWVSSATRKPTEALGGLLLSPEDERRLGAQLSAQVKQEEQVLDDPEVQQYVQRVGQHVAAAIPEDERLFEFEFTVLDTPETVNAFALPGGHIFVNSGLIRAVGSEAELASVLAHEVAHVTLEHPSQQLAAQVGVSTLAQLALGNDPGLLQQLASGIAAQGYLAAHSRDAEAEADETGLGYLAAAGYSPKAMPRFFDELSQMARTQPNVVSNFFATHPAPGDRSADLQRMIRERGYGPGRTSIIGPIDRIQAQVPTGPKVGQAPGAVEDPA